MLLHHMLLFDANRSGITFLPFSKDLSVTLGLFFKVCLPIFIFISAYGLAIAYRDNPQKGFAPARAARLMLNYWVIFVVTIIAVLINGEDIGMVYGKGITGAINALFDFLGLSCALGTPTLCAIWWYMFFALLIIFIVPIVCRVYNSVGASFAVAACIILLAYGNQESSIHYLCSVVLGVCFALGDYFTKITKAGLFKSAALNTAFRILIEIVLFAVLFYTRTFMELLALSDMLLPIVVSLLAYDVLCNIPLLNRFLEYLGNNSLYIFLTHYLLQTKFASDIVFALKNIWLCTIVLLALTVVLCLALEWIKKATKYNLLVKNVFDKLS